MIARCTGRCRALMIDLSVKHQQRPSAVMRQSAWETLVRLLFASIVRYCGPICITSHPFADVSSFNQCIWACLLLSVLAPESRNFCICRVCHSYMQRLNTSYYGCTRAIRCHPCPSHPLLAPLSTSCPPHRLDSQFACIVLSAPHQSQVHCACVPSCPYVRLGSLLSAVGHRSHHTTAKAEPSLWGLCPRGHRLPCSAGYDPERNLAAMLPKSGSKGRLGVISEGFETDQGGFSSEHLAAPFCSY
jgi:hypothetical protein